MPCTSVITSVSVQVELVLTVERLVKVNISLYKTQTAARCNRAMKVYLKFHKSNLFEAQN